MNKFSSSIGKAMVFVLFGMIMIGFVFTGFTPDVQFFSKVDSVATVDGSSISAREFSMAFKRSSEMFKNQMNNQMRGFLKQQVLQQLITQKIYQNFATQLDINYGEDALKAEIKKLKYFQTNDQFDVRLYKNLLIQNGLTPSDFEEEVLGNLKAQASNNLINSYLLPKAMYEDHMRFEKQIAIIRGVKVTKKDLQEFVTVNQDEIKTYISDEKNKSRLESEYNLNKANFVKGEEIKASHILIRIGEDGQQKALERITEIKNKVNTKNFNEIAAKESEDQTAKQNKGDLGWFGKGRMTEEFERVAFNLKKGEISNPVKTEFGFHLIYVQDKKPALNKKLEDVQESLAKSILQKQKTKELDELYQRVTDQLFSAYETKNYTQINRVARKYNLVESKDAELSLLSSKVLNSTINFQNLKKIFMTKDQSTFQQKDGLSTVVFRVLETKEASKSKDSTQDLEAKMAQMSNEFRFDLLQSLRDSANIQHSPDKIDRI